jgi:hypothetical protein
MDQLINGRGGKACHRKRSFVCGADELLEQMNVLLEGKEDIQQGLCFSVSFFFRVSLTLFVMVSLVVVVVVPVHLLVW